MKMIPYSEKDTKDANHLLKKKKKIDPHIPSDPIEDKLNI